MIAQTITNPPATLPGPVVVLLLLVLFGGLGYLALADARRDLRDFELREQFRRDQQAQDEWDRIKRAMAPKAYR